MEKLKIRPPGKYKMAKDIQTPPRIYDYVTEMSWAKSKQNQLTQFFWKNRGSFSFFLTYTQSVSQSVSQSNKLFHLSSLQKQRITSHCPVKDFRSISGYQRSFTQKLSMIGFCRAMLCISAAYVVRCLSVCLSRILSKRCWRNLAGRITSRSRHVRHNAVVMATAVA